MHKKKVALVVGSFTALLHVIWGLAIAFGLAQSWIDFVYNLHSLNNPFVVMPFDLMRTLGLIVVTFIIGYVVGYIFAIVWNKFHK